MNTVSGVTDGKISAKDVHKLRQLVPFQSVFYLRRIVNAFGGGTSEAIDAEGADHKSFVDRITDTAPVETK